VNDLQKPSVLSKAGHDPEKAKAEFFRMVRWIVAIAVIFTAGAILYLGLTGELYLHLVVATIGGVFFSVLLGCGLMAASFFSDKSGHDQSVTDATTGRPKD
jgi:hypothetical protein